MVFGSAASEEALVDSFFGAARRADKQSSLGHVRKEKKKSFVIAEHILLSSSGAYHICISAACALKIEGFFWVWTCSWISTPSLSDGVACTVHAYRDLYV